MKNLFLKWINGNDGSALTETVILMPVMISLLMACFDLGQGILMNQKSIGAAQVIGDLIGRNRSITLADLDDMIVAGEMVFEPYSTATFGYDIVSLEFDDDSNPVILWRVTNNMMPDQDSIDSTADIASPGEGVVVVTSVYQYTPYFANFIVDEINMREVSFVRGRKSPTVVCDDCPGG